MIETCSIDILKGRMNDFAKLHQPFLFIVNFEQTEGYFISDPLNQTEILFKCGNGSNKNGEVLNKSLSSDEGFFSMFPIAYEEYKQKFEIVRKGIYRGDSFLVNLTVKTPIETSFSLYDIFQYSQSPYQLYVPDKFVCFSPETFVRIEQQKIMTYPMKGTIDATFPDAAEQILNDVKETAEHNTIVDLMRNDLGIHASQIKINRFRYLDKINSRGKDLLQVSSEIEGKLSVGEYYELGTILFDMLPAGSISGAPKQSTLQIIRSAEGLDRGYYTGVFGYYDGFSFDSAVLIRYIEQEDDKLYFRSGGGITANSDSRKEYNEVIDKIYLPFV